MSDQSSSNIPHSQPMAIPIGHGRRRAGSISESSSSPSSSSSSDSSYSPPLNTPFAGDRINRPRVAPISPSTSPILSYFLAQSPKSPTGTFPFRRNFGTSAAEDDESEIPVIAKHPRRASMASWSATDRSPQAPQPQTQMPDNQQDRAAGLLRRLSLGAGALARPHLSPPSNAPRAPTPPNTAVERPSATAPQAATLPVPRRPRRSATVGANGSRPPRAPSPMGERILKGHFDGFN